MPPRRPDEMSVFESRDDSLASPLRARSLLTVRAAISSARSSDEPRSLSDSFTCSYCLARLLPFLTPRGGMSASSVEPREWYPGQRGRNAAPAFRPQVRVGIPLLTNERGGRDTCTSAEAFSPSSSSSCC